jgi:excisionase family DNA binding protein
MKTRLIPAHERIGLSCQEAAELIGVSASLFTQMVQDGRMPGPKLINSRRVWSRVKIEKAFAELPEEEPSATDKWEIE